MANRLKMAKVHSIQTLHARGWSQRRIARELGVHREAVQVADRWHLMHNLHDAFVRMLVRR